MNFYEHFAKDESHDHSHDHGHEHEFVKARKSSSRPAKSCEFCSDHWGTVVRTFSSYEEFEKSPFFGGEDTVINDPEAKIAVWVGKNNVGRNSNDWWLCAPVHVFCGCEFDTHRFQKQDGKELEDWYSSLEWD